MRFDSNSLCYIVIDVIKHEQNLVQMEILNHYNRHDFVTASGAFDAVFYRQYTFQRTINLKRKLFIDQTEGFEYSMRKIKCRHQWS